ncbi:O-antigen ligase family protein [Metabacillus idriensis]|uniref:O-antigen ligase family protein n=1 Tax=Metabacillus idriensis TaxID=324768 RepID=UPI003D284820
MNEITSTSINKNLIYVLNNFVLVLIHILLMIDFIMIDLNVPIILEFGLLLLILINIKKLMCYKVNKADGIIIIIMSFILCMLLLYRYLITSVSFVEIRYLIISVLIILLFSTIDVSKKVWDKISLITLFTGIILILMNYNSSMIGAYFYAEKNAFAPILLISTIWIIGTFTTRSKFFTIIFLILSLFSLAILQSRLNLITLIIVVVLLLVYLSTKNMTQKNLVWVISSFFLISILLYLFFTSEIFSEVVLRQNYLMYVQGNSLLDKITSGRITSFNNNLKYFQESPLFGTFFNQYYINNDPNSSVGIHSIWVRFLSYGGILLFIPFFIIVFILVKKVKKESKINIVTSSLLIVGLVNSFGEPFAPFGPLSSYFLFWAMLGFALKEKI